MGRSANIQQEIDRATRTAKEQLKFILANGHHLRKVRNGVKYHETAKAFQAKIDQGDELTPNVMSYIDGIYENTMKGAGLGSVGLRIDGKRRTNLNYGR